jgi:hypothetical protein
MKKGGCQMNRAHQNLQQFKARTQNYHRLQTRLHQIRDQQQQLNRHAGGVYLSTRGGSNRKSGLGTAAVGAGIGGFVGGPVGAAIGGAVGWLIGKLS